MAGEVDSARALQLSGVAAGSRGRSTVLDPRSTRLRAGLQASWEADLYGAKALASHAARLDAERAELARQGMETVIAAEVANAYLGAAILARRSELGERGTQLRDQATRIAERLFAAGRLSRPEVVAREREHKAAQAGQAELESAYKQRLFQLGVLTGTTAGEDEAHFTHLDTLLIPAAPATLPGELLERRPDVRQRLNEVAAEAARVGISQRELYPKLLFSWDTTLERTRIDQNSASRGLALGYGVSLSLPILDGGRIRAQIRVSEARLKEAMATYEKAMLEALADAQTVLVHQKSAETALRLSERSLELARESSEQTRRLFAAGQTDRSRILASELDVLEARDTQLKALGAYWASGVDVLRAFSGPLDATGEEQTRLASKSGRDQAGTQPQ
jgi:multidrug efflux system outer membrane protein